MPAQQSLSKTLQALDDFHESMSRSFDTYRMMSMLVEDLCCAYDANPSEDWLPEAQKIFHGHPASAMILQDPFTKHSVNKPRGYAGDAVLLDFIYEHSSMDDSIANTPHIGYAIMRHNLDSPSAVAVRSRANILASRIGDMAASVIAPEILSVACGHARELELFAHENTEILGRFIAFDQDIESLRVANEHGKRFRNFQPVKGSIIDLIKGKDIGEFDFIYSAGLYDYLNPALARRLTSRLFSRLKPGGHLLVGNFLKGIRDRGYMAVCMDWTLIYRNKEEIIHFSDEIPSSDVDAYNYYTDPVRNVGYLDIKKRA